jgi:hypothetical protein
MTEMSPPEVSRLARLRASMAAGGRVVVPLRPPVRGTIGVIVGS